MLAGGVEVNDSRRWVVLKSKSVEGTEEPGRDGATGGTGETGVPRSPYWLIVREGPRGWEIFTGALLGKVVLPVFDSEEGVWSFLGSLAEGGSGWWPKEVGAGELISVLSGSGFGVGPGSGVERVLFDPLPEAVPEVVDAGPGAKVETMSRRCFLEHLMGRAGSE